MAVYNLMFPDAPVMVTTGNMTMVKEGKQPTTPEPAPSEIIKEYEKDVVPDKKEESKSESRASLSEISLPQSELRQFIGCRRR